MAELKISRGVSKDEALNAIRCGVHDSMRELMGGGSGGSPGDNFYLAIKDGIREAVRAVARGPRKLHHHSGPDLVSRKKFKVVANFLLRISQVEGRELSWTGGFNETQTLLARIMPERSLKCLSCPRSSRARQSDEHRRKIQTRADTIAATDRSWAPRLSGPGSLSWVWVRALLRNPARFIFSSTASTARSKFATMCATIRLLASAPPAS